MLNIVPSLWFADNNCEEAINYYIKVFPNSTINSIRYYPPEDQNEHFEGMSGKILTAEFNLNGVDFIALDGGPIFRFSNAVSFTVLCKDQEELDYYYDNLSDNLEIEQCGWVIDKFGLSWQIVPSNMDRLLQNDEQTNAMMNMKRINIQELEDLA